MKRSISKGNQASISSYFSQSTTPGPSTPSRPSQAKRASSPIDLTLDSDDDQPPPSKRARKTSSFFSTALSPVASSSKPNAQTARATGHAEQWRFNPSSPARNTQVNDSERQRSVHDRAKKILLGGGSYFNRTVHVDESTAINASDGEHDEERARSPSADEADEAEKQFGELMEMFASSKTKKGKAAMKKVTTPSARVKNKKAEEIGPSGQSYTPFELQVRFATFLASTINAYL